MLQIKKGQPIKRATNTKQIQVRKTMKYMQKMETLKSSRLWNQKAWRVKRWGINQLSSKLITVLSTMGSVSCHDSNHKFSFEILSGRYNILDYSGLKIFSGILHQKMHWSLPNWNRINFHLKLCLFKFV